MGWLDLAGAFGDLPHLLSRNDDDVFDRLSHRWTASTLILFALLVSTKQYVGDPITCWVPKHFSGAWEDYTNTFCWVKNTYYVPFDERISKDPLIRSKNPIIYYQWVPLILLVQALMFYFPVTIWRTLNHQTGIDVHDTVETSERLLKCDDMETKKKVLHFLTKQVNRYLRRNKNKHARELCLEGCKLNVKYLMSNCACCCGEKYGNYMSILYAFIKLVYLGNSIGQLFLLNTFLGPWNYQYYGIDVLRAISRGEDWTESPKFPRITMCDFDIRRLGNIHTYTVQCVLPINLFNEKIYLYIWFWLVAVSLLTFVGLIIYLIRFFIVNDSLNYVSKYLSVPHQLYDPHKKTDRTLLKRFVYEYLRKDGMLVIRLIDHNTNKMNMQDVLSALFEYWVGLPHIQRIRAPDDEHSSIDGMDDV